MSLPIASANLTEALDADFVKWFAQNFGWTSSIHWSTSLELIKSMGCHCYSWWRWRSDTLWVILIKLWPHSLSCYLQSVVKISLHPHRYVIAFDYFLFVEAKSKSLTSLKHEPYSPCFKLGGWVTWKLSVGEICSMMHWNEQPLQSWLI